MHDRHLGNRLAATGFTYDGNNFLFIYMIRDTTNGLHLSVWSEKGYAKIFYI